MTFNIKGLGVIFRAIFSNQNTLGAIFSQISTDFTRIFRDFAQIFTKSKLWGVRLQPLHPRLLHTEAGQNKD